MASVDYKKLKSSNEAAAMIRHSDETERLKHEHSNEEIDKTKTKKNINIYNLSYKDTMQKLRDRIKKLDETTNTNKRKDRVECFSLVIPATENMTETEAKNFLQDCNELLKKEFGSENLVNSYIHFDEIHEYIDDFKVKKSRPHMHIFVVPEIGGILNGKKFSSKAEMKRVNKMIDELCRTKYHEAFLTGEKAKKKTVEQLKNQTNDIKNLEKFNELLGKNLFEELKKMLKDKQILKTILRAIEENENEKNLQNDERCL